MVLHNALLFGGVRNNEAIYKAVNFNIMGQRNHQLRVLVLAIDTSHPDTEQHNGLHIFQVVQE